MGVMWSFAMALAGAELYVDLVSDGTVPVISDRSPVDVGKVRLLYARSVGCYVFPRSSEVVMLALAL